MKKGIVFLLALAMAVGLSACKAPTRENPAEATNKSTVAATTEPTVVQTAASSAPTEEPTYTPVEATAENPTEVPPTEVPTEMPTEVPTEVPHSELYVPGVSPDQMVAYFNEVVLDLKYSTGAGAPTLVQKWDRPIYYRIEGVPTRRDAQIISRLSKQLNEVEGFPGIQAATGLEQNLTIYFLREAEFQAQFSHVFDGEMADSAMQFWHYNENNSIYYGRVGYCKDTSQEIRDLVIPKELLNLLGISDTALEKDSADDQEESNKKDSEITVLSDLDLAVVKLLYNPEIQCGMNAAQCEKIIRELYY